ncbi:MAG: hypothetical protein M1366_02175 [Patescibacteria group bacterium]|nr:hypothetical protein [Patescibacteria group bacterium]
MNKRMLLIVAILLGLFLFGQQPSVCSAQTDACKAAKLIFQLMAFSGQQHNPNGVAFPTDASTFSAWNSALVPMGAPKFESADQLRSTLRDAGYEKDPSYSNSGHERWRQPEDWQNPCLPPPPARPASHGSEAPVELFQPGVTASYNIVVYGFILIILLSGGVIVLRRAFARA